jgi:hypothetical protein
MKTDRLIAYFETAHNGPRGVNPDHVVDIYSGGSGAAGSWILMVSGARIQIPNMNVQEVVQRLNGPTGSPYRD